MFRFCWMHRISRVLSPPCGGWFPFIWTMACAVASSSQPEPHTDAGRTTGGSYLRLHPPAGRLACTHYCGSGGLLPHRFTLTLAFAGASPAKEKAVCFLLPYGRPPNGKGGRPALHGPVACGCPDFPRQGHKRLTREPRCRLGIGQGAQLDKQLEHGGGLAWNGRGQGDFLRGLWTGLEGVIPRVIHRHVAQFC